MKIAIFTDLYTPSGSGGIVSSVRAEKAELEALGHEVTVFCPGHVSKESGVFLVPSHSKIKISGAILAKRPSQVEKFIIKNYPDLASFDVIHVHYESSCGIAGVHLAKQFKIPLVITMHGREDMAITCNVAHPFKYLTATALERMHHVCLPHNIKVKKDRFQATTRARAKMWRLMVNHAEYADVVTTPADHLAKKLEHYGVTRPIVVVPNGIPASLVPTGFTEREMKDGDVLRMVWNSRLSKEKRFMAFLQAVGELKRPYVLYVYGSGNALKKAKRYATEHGLKVKFFGHQPREKILERMMNSHLSVLASYNFDVHPMVMLEAESIGLPVFTCDPVLIENIPEGSFVLANGPEPSAMAIALDKIKPEDINRMSKIMLKNRNEVLESSQIKKLLGVFKLARKEYDARHPQK